MSKLHFWKLPQIYKKQEKQETCNFTGKNNYFISGAPAAEKNLFLQILFTVFFLNPTKNCKITEKDLSLNNNNNKYIFFIFWNKYDCYIIYFFMYPNSRLFQMCSLSIIIQCVKCSSRAWGGYLHVSEVIS